MTRYVILRNPGHNQVFFCNSTPLSLAELQFLPLPLLDISQEVIADLPYLAFSTQEPLSGEQLETLAPLSSLYALFEKQGETLRPIPLPQVQVYDRSLGTILKYHGKTNEIFTRLLLNLALSAGNFTPKEVNLLDPLAGRGTTLFEAFALGAQVTGVELHEESVSKGYQHMKKFLEQGKFKHKCDSRKFSGENKNFTAKKYTIQCNEQQFQLISADSKYTAQIFPKNHFHLIIADLPYGVQHGSTAGGKTRSPAQLMVSCGKPWYQVLKKNGIIALSWNTLVNPREKMVDSLTKSGFTILTDEPLENLVHPVDASITRDVILAKKL